MKKYISTLLGALMLATVSISADNVTNNNGFNPFKEMLKMQQEMDALFQKFNKEMMQQSAFSNFSTTFPVSPAVDLKDMGDKYSLKANIPGSDQKNIKITAKDGMLKIEAKSSKAKEEKGKGYLKQERFSGEYMRILTLPKDADSANIKSDYKNGVLEITIPKKKK